MMLVVRDYDIDVFTSEFSDAIFIILEMSLYSVLVVIG